MLDHILQVLIQHLKEVSQVDETAVFPFVSNSDVFDLPHVSLSELRCQHPRHASDFMLLLIIDKNKQGSCSNVLRQLKTESQWKYSNPQILDDCQLL